ncbi:hypothetical protein [Micromonospora sp. CPCC 205556]|uniref:hypothetical protein n=1 Tax=Micromonospora sp. CPCC 205556 TaxID=3122398 RepID=UPI002FEE6B2E
MTDPTTPMPSEQPTTSPPSDGQMHSAPQPGPSPAGVPLPTPGDPAAQSDMLTSTTTLSRRSRTRAYAVGGLALVIALCCGGVGITALAGSDAEPAAQASAAPSSPPSTSAPTTAAPTTAAATTAAPTTAAYEAPTKKDFKLAVKVLRKKCFGSAGCNISYRIDVTYTGTGLDPANTYEVTYEVRGGEDPMVNTFEVTGDTASVQQEEDGSTRRSRDKLTAVVTDVAEL